jgi:hypothetical protein
MISVMVWYYPRKFACNLFSNAPFLKVPGQSKDISEDHKRQYPKIPLALLAFDEICQWDRHRRHKLVIADELFVEDAYFKILSTM